LISCQNPDSETHPSKKQKRAEEKGALFEQKQEALTLKMLGESDNSHLPLPLQTFLNKNDEFDISDSESHKGDGLFAAQPLAKEWRKTLQPGQGASTSTIVNPSTRQVPIYAPGPEGEIECWLSHNTGVDYLSHSDTPNVRLEFNTKTLQVTLVLLADVEDGEEFLADFSNNIIGLNLDETDQPMATSQ
jgi:hypothetical protein